MTENKITIDYENDQIVIDDVAIEVTTEEGEPLAIDHASKMDGYVAFLEKGSAGGVRPGGAEATVLLKEASGSISE